MTIQSIHDQLKNLERFFIVSFFQNAYWSSVVADLRKGKGPEL
jgi:hypothetical protein